MRINETAYSLIYKWNASKFSRTDRWSTIDNQLSFMDELSKKLNLTSTEAWFGLTSTTMRQHGGRSLMIKYNDSLSKLLSTLLPEYKKACQDFVMEIKDELKLDNVADVLRVPGEYHFVSTL